MMLFTTQLSLSLETRFTTFRYSLFSGKNYYFELCPPTLLHSLQSGLNPERVYAAAVIKLTLDINMVKSPCWTNSCLCTYPSRCRVPRSWCTRGSISTHRQSLRTIVAVTAEDASKTSPIVAEIAVKRWKTDDAHAPSYQNRFFCVSCYFLLTSSSSSTHHYFHASLQ